MPDEPFTADPIKLDEEIVGDDFATKNYRFSKIGESVPIIKSGDATSSFDPKSLPLQPLAVSERFRLLFLSNPQAQGFYVARTKDVIASAEAIKNKKPAQSVQELSLVHVPIGKVSILAVSADDSVLAATVSSHVHFFAVSALLYKEQKPSYSVSLDDSICIKDVRWAKKDKDAKAYVILSSDGKLYHGSGQGPPTCVMEGVDSVDWSVRDNCIAVAKNNVVSILTSHFKEKLRFLLSFQTVIDDSDVDQFIKVDSLRWIRPDSLVVGCFQLNDDGEKENYIVQYVTSRGGRITDASMKPIVLSFNYLFTDFSPDDVPTSAGPHLFLSYLVRYGLAFVANRVSREVSLFRWPQDSGKNDAVRVEILDDNWTLHIESQDNDEENVLLGLAIDKASQNENLSFTLGDEETDVSPCCVIICPTIDGKISFFYFASAAAALELAEDNASSEEDDASQVPMKHELPLLSSAGSEESTKLISSTIESHEHRANEVEKTSVKVTTAISLSSSSNLDIRPKEQTTVEKMGSQTLKVDDPKKALSMVLKEHDNTGHHSISEVLASKGFPSGKVQGDVSHQSVSTYSSVGSNVESIHKLLPMTPSPWSLSLSEPNARDNASRLSDKVDSSDKNTLQSTGNILKHAADSKDKPSATFIPFGQTSLNAQGNNSTSDKVDSSDKNTLQSTGNILKHSTDFKDKPSATFIPFGQTSLNAQGNNNTSDMVDSSDKNTLQSTGNILKHSTDFKDKLSATFFPFGQTSLNAQGNNSTLQSTGNILKHSTDFKEKPSAAFTPFGLTSLNEQGNRKSQSAYPSSQGPSASSFASGKAFQSEFRKELNAPTSQSLLTHSVLNASKQFGNVEEMARKLDNLLESIEGNGGFRDASITSQTQYVTELEEGIWALSDRCRMWKGLLNEKLGETQVLLEKTVEVLARKIYMEGLVKQRADRKYWEFWNRKKLSSELELKQRRIFELNQELTNKLIELERHFNSLEINKFRENEGNQRDRRALQNRQGRSRQIQSLHSVHNTITAQLSAAEQLSGCLSKQMAALCIESSGKHDVKKLLFESIGISYVGDNERSPVRDRTYDIPPNKEYSGSVSAENSRRNQSSFAKGSEPQTARRRRDSLDCSWVSFDPPKSTVKRVLREDYEKGSPSRPLLNINKQYFSPQKTSEVARLELLNASGVSLNQYRSQGFGTSGQLTESPSPLYHVTARLQERAIQVSPTKNSSAWQPQSVSQTKMSQNSELGAYRDEKTDSALPSTNSKLGAYRDEKTKSGLPSTGTKFSFVQQSDTSFHPSPSMSGQLLGQSLSSPFGSIGNLDQFKAAINDQKNSNLPSEANVDTKIPVTSPSAFSSTFNVSDKSTLNKNSEKPSSPSDGQSASSPLQSVLGSSSPLSNNPSPSFLVSKPSSSLFPTIPFHSESNMAAKEEVSEKQTSVASPVTLSSTLPSLTGGINFASEPSASIIKSQPSFPMFGSKTELQNKVDNMPSKTEMCAEIQTSASQPALATSAPDVNLRTPASFATTELSTNSKSGSQDDIGGSSKNSPLVSSVINAEVPSSTEAISTIAVSSGAISNSSHEEEMEEEAPETNQTTEPTFANLDSFGIGPTQNSTTAKANPFGLTALNKDSAFSTSPFMMSQFSGELFRPASFNFQPPQPLQPPAGNFSGGFGSGVTGQVSAPSGFGQPAQIGAGQQALGSVFGSFGQSRQLGTTLPGSNAAPVSGFGNAGGGGFGLGFTAAPSGGGFGGLAAGGGFAAAATACGGFAAAATAGGGFAAAATGGSGFSGGFAGAGGGFAGVGAGGGFAGVGAGGGFAGAGASSGGGYGAFNNQPGSGGFSSSQFGSGTGRPPAELFTQMRK